MNPKGDPDGSLSRYPSLRSFWLGGFLDSLRTPLLRAEVFFYTFFRDMDAEGVLTVRDAVVGIGVRAEVVFGPYGVGEDGITNYKLRITNAES